MIKLAVVRHIELKLLKEKSLSSIWLKMARCSYEKGEGIAYTKGVNLELRSQDIEK
jgi:hypothetical protein